VTKDEIRKEVLRRRLAMDETEVSARSASICGRVISDDVFVTARSIGLYWPFRNEVLTRAVFREAVSGRKKVAFPVVNARKRAMDYITVNDQNELSEGAYGIMEPRFDPERRVGVEELDLIVVPGVAFDERGYRIGYGGGYFDRLLAGDVAGAKRAALAFDLQLVDRIPHEAHDTKVELIFTESRVITCFQKTTCLRRR
jgi:5-formyltetrahydrofolate cyclo-ligase